MHDSLLLSLLLFLFLCAKDRFPFTGLLAFLILWMLRSEVRNPLPVLLVCLICILPRYSTAYPEEFRGRITTVRESYIIVSSGIQHILVYTDSLYLYDTEVTVSGPFHNVTEQSGFFSFSAVSWASSIGVRYTGEEENLHIIRENATLRSTLQKKIMNGFEGDRRILMLKILLHIDLDSSQNMAGVYSFSGAGIMMFFEMLLQYLMEEKNRNRVLLLINAVFCVLYGFPLILMQRFIFRLLRMTSMACTDITGTGLCITMLIYPNQIRTAAFLIPAVFRLISVMKGSRWTVYGCSLCLQSIFYGVMYPLKVLLFPLMIRVSGIFWAAAVIQLVIPEIPLIDGIRYLDGAVQLMERFCLRGSCIGAGTVFFVLLLLTFRKKKRFDLIFLTVLLVFQTSGLFHPFAEVTFINVGQGDSILIRMPLNTCNILIDTGKPSQWNTLQTYLNAKSVNSIDTLFITHADNDHSGNAENIMNTYHVKEMVTQHEVIRWCGPLKLYDLNMINDPEDENRSSIVLYFMMNGLRYLCMGDADEYAEEDIIRRYGNLKTDILKLSHHGSQTGSSDLFLDAVRPRLGIISSGPYYIYHHPSEATLQRLLKRHIPYLDTKTEGDISILCLPFCNILITSKGAFSLL